MIRIKICGIKDEQNAAQVACLNVDFMGLIFAPSPRQVSENLAKNLSELIQKNAKKAIGVFVDESDEFIINSAQNANLNGVQIQKSISKSLFERLKGLNLSVWQVVSVGEKLQMPAQINADLVLFDTKGALKGGNGVAFKWDLLKGYDKKFALAGGLGADNVAAALNATNALGQKPSILDLNSRVEKAAGIKDTALISEILDKLHKIKA